MKYLQPMEKRKLLCLHFCGFRFQCNVFNQRNFISFSYLNKHRYNHYCFCYFQNPPLVTVRPFGQDQNSSKSIAIGSKVNKVSPMINGEIVVKKSNDEKVTSFSKNNDNDDGKIAETVKKAKGSSNIASARATFLNSMANSQDVGLMKKNSNNEMKMDMLISI